MGIIVLWISFVLTSGITIVVAYAFFDVLKEEEYEDSGDKWIPIALVTSLFLVFTASKEIFNPQIALNIWRIGAVTLIAYMVACYSILKGSLKLLLNTQFWISVLIGIVPFSIKFKGAETSKFDYINNTTTIEFLKIWLPPTLILVTSLILWSYFYQRTLKEQKRMLRNLLTDKDYSLGHRLNLEDIDSKYFRRLNEDILYMTEKNMKNIEVSLSKYYNQLNNLIEINESNRNLSIKSEPNYDNKELKTILTIIEDLKFKVEHSNPISTFKYSDNNNQIFIRELYHYLVTPLSQIEAKSKFLNQEDNDRTLNQIALRSYIETINTSVEICKSVLLAYRELAFVSSSSEWNPSSLKYSLESASKLYQESQNKSVKMLIELPDNFEYYSNNFLLSIFLPLLENAIHASPNNETIRIKYTLDSNFIIFSISNIAINVPTLHQLNAPGFSSKKEHIGTGLSIIRHIINQQQQSDFNFSISSNQITATIKLLNRKKYE